ncbi:MAG TPA: hypothetical protein VJH96_02960 [Patescibacteria group bacterium]|nr:hypothetical protein [Patescibacteria group bacterium]
MKKCKSIPIVNLFLTIEYMSDRGRKRNRHTPRVGGDGVIGLFY